MQLNYSEIHARVCDHTNLFLTDYEISNIQSTNYDLRLGKQCYIGSTKKKKSGIVSLKEGQAVVIPSNGIFFFETKETISMPADLTAKLSLRMSLVSKGLFMPVQGPIAPGFKNHLYGMLYNLSDSDIVLREGDSIVSIEFHKITPVGNDQLYKGQYKGRDAFSHFTQNKIISSLNRMSQDFNDKFKTTFRLLQIASYVLIAITAVFAIFALLNNIFPDLFKLT